jgi:hypothetical protein
MEKKIFVFSLLLCVGIYSSCNSDNLSEVDVLSQIENVVFIDNPYAMNESNAVSNATSFLNHVKKVSLRSSNSSETVTGYGQSWFNSEMFTATNITHSFNPGTDIVYPYRYECGIITDIQPNPNNTGSTNANWRARSTYSY